MNKTFKILVTSLFLAASFQASAAIITDTYIGSDDHGKGDRIGSSHYEVYNMDVTFSDGFMTVRVNTNFDEASDIYGITYGDLFISSDGWNPYGSAPYLSDSAATGEKWEFVFDTSEGTLYGGDFSISLSQDLVSPAYVFRTGQEVQRAAGGTALGGSSVDLSHAGTGGYVEYRILLSSLGLPASTTDLGLKWGMSCANDTIEGRVALSEATTALMLMLGLVGLGSARRFKKA